MNKLYVPLKFDPPISPERLAREIRLRLPTCHVSSVQMWVEDGYQALDDDEGSGDK